MDSFRRTRGFSANVVGTDMIRFAGQRGEGFLIAGALGSVPLGLYAVASRFLQLLNEIFTSTIGSVAFPVFSRLQNDPDRRNRALLSVIRMTALAAFPAFAGLAVLAPEIVVTVLGPRWTATVVLVQLLALQGLRFATTYFVSSVVISTGNSRLELRMTVAGVTIKVIALAIGISWGVRGVASAVVIESYASLPLTFWGLRFTTGLTARRYLAQVVPPGVAAAVMVIAVQMVRVVTAGRSDVVTIAAAVPVGAAVYLAMLAGTAPATIREARHNIGEVLARRRRPARREPVAQP
jgi:PST family polysaccharide transporter